MRKEKMFAMRMSLPDYERIHRKAEQAGMSMTGFLTLSALEKSIVVVNGLDNATAELKAIGRNLNQITTLCNMGKIRCPDLNEVQKVRRGVRFPVWPDGPGLTDGNCLRG
ncbi:plasmid mobilization protein [Caproicibacter fermentans]|uniref:Plasmid mobilization relaxosome protein MobC n=1 Tax=Caproicibacter fermentans TaxID=2576756 RepID=A0A7G8T9J2_9FIRM|nr:plasmid mobilization relaxosome protein MobC [Caproicibacter fermentans]QNK40283.1 plasmid mobilization relaxosome protein MobC [Caproicibacter fermentans]